VLEQKSEKTINPGGKKKDKQFAFSTVAGSPIRAGTCEALHKIKMEGDLLKRIRKGGGGAASSGRLAEKVFMQSEDCKMGGG